jgi:hypothetical protein
VASAGVHHVYDLVYDDLEFATPKDAKVHPSVHARILAALPTTWTDLLRNGIEPLIPGEWVLTSRHFPTPDVLRTVNHLDNGSIVCDLFPVREDGTFHLVPTPAQVSVPASSLIRCHVVQLSRASYIVESPLDRLELDASRVTVLQGPRKAPTPILDSSVHGTAAALTIRPTGIDFLVDTKWSPILDNSSAALPWPRVWRDTWSPIRRTKVSDFLWRLWHQRLFLGIERRQFPDPGPLNCPHPACSHTMETYDHFLFSCPVAQALWDYMETIWRDITGRALPSSRSSRIAGPSFRTKTHRALWLVLHGETLYSLWIQRCRARLDNDPTAYTHIAVLAAASTSIQRV